MQQVDAGVFARRESKVRSYSRSFGAVFERASGSEVFDVDGRRYLDFLAGCSSLNYGHNDPDLKAALLAHVEADTLNHGLDLFSVPKARFLEAMERIVLAPRGLPHLVQFTGPTGTNAVEAAIKLARSVTGRTN
ncbi:MAG: aminotransferase class III-fold pyridoxal phosphate-dependent enzyme, partial [Acidimicrobiales bacterium]